MKFKTSLATRSLTLALRAAGGVSGTGPAGGRVVTEASASALSGTAVAAGLGAEGDARFSGVSGVMIAAWQGWKEETMGSNEDMGEGC